MFQLHEQLARDCEPMGRFPLCQLLLVDDSNYPWFLLVPRRERVCEIFDLSVTDRHELLSESMLLAGWLAQEFQADKLNIATLGNQVAQLHVHYVVRYLDDVAWPNPVWGRVPARPYEAQEMEQMRRRVFAGALEGLREDL